jgi:hypothetical protein
MRSCNINRQHENYKRPALGTKISESWRLSIRVLTSGLFTAAYFDDSEIGWRREGLKTINEGTQKERTTEVLKTRPVSIEFHESTQKP